MFHFILLHKNIYTTYFINTLPRTGIKSCRNITKYGYKKHFSFTTINYKSIQPILYGMFIIDNNLLLNYKNLLNFKNLNYSKIYRKTYLLYNLCNIICKYK
jgi:hypothetical protein